MLFLVEDTLSIAGQLECKQVVSGKANDGSSRIQMGEQACAITQHGP